LPRRIPIQKLKQKHWVSAGVSYSCNQHTPLPIHASYGEFTVFFFTLLTVKIRPTITVEKSCLQQQMTNTLLTVKWKWIPAFFIFCHIKVSLFFTADKIL
jgi:hypothetical protein